MTTARGNRVRKTVLARATAVGLGLTMAVGLAACGDDDEDADTGTDTTEATSSSAAEDESGTDEESSSSDDESSADDGGGEASGDFSGCQVTDTGGVDDDSFNETAFAGLERAGEEVGFEAQFLESQSESDFAPNIDTFVEQGCDLIITVGFLLGDATAAAAEANPDQQFAIVDNDFFDSEAGEDITYENVRELTFSTDEAAFLAGYLAAATTESGIVGTYGGINIPPVTIFMNGFANGVAFYNEETGEDVQVIGWDVAAQDGLFTGDFEDQTQGRQTTETLLDQGADIILPVAGPVGLGTIEAIEAGGGTQRVIWVDTDGCVSVPDACPLFLTSIEKKMDNAVHDITVAAAEGEFEGGLYVGTLENDGVGLADFNQTTEDVPQDLADRIEELRAGIIDGSISVDG